MKHHYEHDLFYQLSILKDNGGFTAKQFELVSYKTGWQVATEGFETRSIVEAVAYVRKLGGTCGVWYSNGIYYIDKCRRVDTKKAALSIGRDHQQISVFGWARGVLAYC